MNGMRSKRDVFTRFHEIAFWLISLLSMHWQPYYLLTFLICIYMKGMFNHTLFILKFLKWLQHSSPFTILVYHLKSFLLVLTCKNLWNRFFKKLFFLFFLTVGQVQSHNFGCWWFSIKRSCKIIAETWNQGRFLIKPYPAISLVKSCIYFKWIVDVTDYFLPKISANHNFIRQVYRNGSQKLTPDVSMS